MESASLLMLWWLCLLEMLFLLFYGLILNVIAGRDYEEMKAKIAVGSGFIVGLFILMAF